MLALALVMQNAGPVTYTLAGWLFLRLLGLIYAVAFLSLWTQIIGLVGQKGILPAADFLRSKKFPGRKRFHLLPTLCWWNASDGALHGLCGGGLALSLLLVAGFVPAPVLVLLWLFHLSLFTVGRIFLGYQWDVLLLETGFLAIFLTPLELWPHWPPAAEPAPVVRWLFYWLLFRLMFSSGWVKLGSGDRAWRSMTALQHHYESQPLPNRVSWHVHQLPGWFHEASCVVMFVIELVVPFFFFAPPPLSYVAVAGTLFFMLLILVTGSYCFFNLLAMALCVLVIDDGAFRRLVDPFFPDWLGEVPPSESSGWPVWVLVPVAVVLLSLSLVVVRRLFHSWFPLPPGVGKLHSWLEPLLLVNSYGLFSVMTTHRYEIIVEGSDDGHEWLAYEFKWKPGNVTVPPRQAAPHQPRLDWQMWFAALGDYQGNPWFGNFLRRLLEGAPAVTRLLAKNPFLDAPPRYIRATLHDYRFTDRKTRRATGAWWQRSRLWLYSPVLSLRGTERQFMPPDEEDEL